MAEAETFDPFKLPHAPIIEAVLDIDCDLPPDLDRTELERAGRDAFRPDYPKFRKQLIHEAEVMMKAEEEPRFSARQGVRSFQFLSDNEKQIVQVRVDGFSFNRLAPYSSLDDYLPEIGRCWGIFKELARPRLIRKIALRYINRIVIPAEEGAQVDLKAFLTVGPRLPAETGLTFTGFLNQHQAMDKESGNSANIILASEPFANGGFPIVLDIEVWKQNRLDPARTDELMATVHSLRALKNRIFKHTLTPECLSLYQQPPS